MKDPHIPPSMAQLDAITYQEILDLDSRPVPPFMRERRVPDLGTEPVPTAHYTSPEIFRESIDRMWLRTWQMACREEQIPEVGDFHVYDIVGKSLIVVRSAPDEIRALHNVCLHRGRRLVTQPGRRNSFMCPYHGLRWNIDGSFAHNPFEWDFSHCPSGSMKLPEARVERWGGFVWVNFDPDAPPLSQALGPIPDHFARWGFENKYIAAHVGKRAKASYLVTMEAFMETHHAITTHPQILPYVTTGNCQYDVFTEHVCRHISARSYQSTEVTRKIYTQDEIASIQLAQALHGSHGAASGPAPAQEGEFRLPEGTTARAYIADLYRRHLAAETGRSMEHAADCELGDSLIYSVYPNFQMWGGFLPNWVYRIRPVGMKHDESMMEIYILRDVPQGSERPRPATFRMLGDDERWATATELGGLGPIIDQDWSHMEQMQLGLQASANGVVQLGHYLEMKIRHHHQVLKRYLAR